MREGPDGPSVLNSGRAAVTEKDLELTLSLFLPIILLGRSHQSGAIHIFANIMKLRSDREGQMLFLTRHAKTVAERPSVYVAAESDVCSVVTKRLRLSPLGPLAPLGKK